MSYTVKSSEKLRKIGSDFETKAMLYLLNFRDDSSEMQYFIVDFFNDITGMDRMARKLWDVQSKATKSATAKTIGRELVTLFKNFISDLDFYTYIVFLGDVPATFRIKPDSNIFQIDNIQNKALKSVKSGLKAECQAKEYIPKDRIDEKSIDEFLSKVWFVVDDKSPADYIRAIIKNHPKIIPADSALIAIFNEIRNKQSEKKNSIVEGVVIENVDEVLNYGRHLSSGEIRLLVLQRIIHNDPLSKGVPAPFIEILSKTPEEMREPLIEDCKRSLCRALFNKSAAQGFWEMFETIYDLIMKYPNKSIDYIFRTISDDVKNGCPDFDVLSLKYFIAQIKDGILQ